ncbi:EamA family transporter [Clostridium sp. OS1-26]|uniref:EamA family transporter n=1 Tax=Clostridium sp. OS1-26 TaxID=3070681 RepID=UPI0027E1ADB4|nr:EamA family transporter [Clostridium sp. OS1-26]WML32712.1 EamA family transporter [Clostridium sp. OS1-26]
MNNMWLVYALLSAVCASLVAIFGKVGLQSIDANTATAIRSVVMAVFLVIVVATQGSLSKIPEIISNKKAISSIFLSGIAGALSWLFYFLALKFGTVPKVAPIDKLSVVIAAILAAAFLGEKMSMMNCTGIGLIAIGAIIVALS